MEIEIKLGPVDPALAARVFDDRALLPEAGPEDRIRMETTYFDDPQGRFGAQRMTLRLRRENGSCRCTFKTAPQGLARVELECPADSIQQGAAALAALPETPEEARALLEGGRFLPVCGARFVRRTRLCRAAGTTFHLCLDQGELVNGRQVQPLCELELELAEGSAGDLQAAALALRRAYGLPVCPFSKQQRALALGSGL